MKKKKKFNLMKELNYFVRNAVEVWVWVLGRLELVLVHDRVESETKLKEIGKPSWHLCYDCNQ